MSGLGVIKAAFERVGMDFRVERDPKRIPKGAYVTLMVPCERYLADGWQDVEYAFLEGGSLLGVFFD